MATSPCLRNLPGVSSCPAFVNHFSLSRHANATPAKSRVFMLKIKPGANVTLEQRLPIPNKTRIQLIIRNAVEDLVNTSRNHSKYTPLQNSPFEYLRYSQTFSSGFWQGFADFSSHFSPILFKYPFFFFTHTLHPHPRRSAPSITSSTKVLKLIIHHSLN